MNSRTDAGRSRDRERARIPVVHGAAAQEERPAFPRFAAVRSNHTCGSSRAPVTRLCRPLPSSALGEDVPFQRLCSPRAVTRQQTPEENHYEITISRQLDQSHVIVLRVHPRSQLSYLNLGPSRPAEGFLRDSLTTI